VNWINFRSSLDIDNTTIITVCIIGNVIMPAAVRMAFRVGAK